MITGIWTNYHYDMPFEQKVEAFLKAGIRYGEFSNEDGFALLERGKGATVGREVRKFIDGCGFSLPQGHLWLHANLTAPDYLESVDKLKNWIDLFDALGIKSGVIHPGFSQDENEEESLAEERRVLAFKALCDYAQGSGVTVCVENMIRTRRAGAYTDAKNLVAFVESVGSPQIGICLDTGHLNIAGGNQYEFITTAGKHLKAIHIADNEGESDQHMMPFGRGTVNWDDVMRGLRAIGYERFCSFEIPGESRAPFEIRQLKLQYVKGVMEYMGFEV